MRATAPCCSPQAVGPGVLVGVGIGVAVGIAVGAGEGVALGVLVGAGAGVALAVFVGRCVVGALVGATRALGAQPAIVVQKKIVMIALRIQYCRTQNYRHNARSRS